MLWDDERAFVFSTSEAIVIPRRAGIYLYRLGSKWNDNED